MIRSPQIPAACTALLCIVSPRPGAAQAPLPVPSVAPAGPAQLPPGPILTETEEIGQANFIVVGKILEVSSDSTKEKEGRTSYLTARIKIESLLRGRRADLVKAYRRTFPLFAPTIFWLAGGQGHGHAAPTPEFELHGKQGQRMIFFVRLLTTTSTTSGTVPPTVKARYGPYIPTLFKTAPLSQRGAIKKAIQRFTRQQRAIRQDAGKTAHRDRKSVV